MDNKINPLRGAAKFIGQMAEDGCTIILGPTELKALASFMNTIMLFDEEAPSQQAPSQQAPSQQAPSQQAPSQAPPKLCILCGSDMFKTKCDWICTGCNHVIRGECG